MKNTRNDITEYEAEELSAFIADPSYRLGSQLFQDMLANGFLNLSENFLINQHGYIVTEKGRKAIEKALS
jgi:predicted transcriptional regulator